MNELLAKSSKTDPAISQVSEQVTKLEDGGVKNLEDTIMGVKRHLMSFGRVICKEIKDVSNQVGPNSSTEGDMALIKMEIEEMKRDVEEIKGDVHRLVRKINRLLDSGVGNVVHIHNTFNRADSSEVEG